MSDLLDRIVAGVDFKCSLGVTVTVFICWCDVGGKNLQRRETPVCRDQSGVMDRDTKSLKTAELKHILTITTEPVIIDQNYIFHKRFRRTYNKCLNVLKYLFSFAWFNGSVL